MKKCRRVADGVAATPKPAGRRPYFNLKWCRSKNPSGVPRASRTASCWVSSSASHRPRSESPRSSPWISAIKSGLRRGGGAAARFPSWSCRRAASTAARRTFDASASIGRRRSALASSSASDIVVSGDESVRAIGAVHSRSVAGCGRRGGRWRCRPDPHPCSHPACKAATALSLRRALAPCWSGPRQRTRSAQSPRSRIAPALGPQNDIVQHQRALPHRGAATAASTTMS